MQVKEAITTAKKWVADLFEGEGVEGIRLEEVRFDEGPENWLITVGIDRPRPASPNIVDRLRPELKRSYKVVTLNDRTGELVSVTNRSED
jgi:hypothetical protein